ncbi:hypothetical protein A5658_20220 [Mycobacterium sp. 1245111.1]|nr:hypothetical protein A5658_20220 [Mycobacterium sp. 1245111.1]
MAPLTGPLLPMPALLRTGAIGSPTESACAAGIEPKTAPKTAAVTMTGRTTDVATISTVSHVVRLASEFVRPVVDRRRTPADLLVAM